MNQERYWRNLIADEIKAEHDKVKTYYQKRGINKGGMSSEEHTRLNIFLLAESIARTMQGIQDAPREIVDSNNISTPPTAHKVETDQLHSFIEEQIEGLSEEQIADLNEIPGQQSIDDIRPVDIAPIQDPVRNLVKDTPYQNEFGEIL